MLRLPTQSTLFPYTTLFRSAYSACMLPAAVVDTARNGVRVAIDERRELLRHEIADLKEQYGLRGTLHGTPYLQAVKQRVASELKIRANLAWQRWARSLATQPSG